MLRGRCKLWQDFIELALVVFGPVRQARDTAEVAIRLGELVVNRMLFRQLLTQTIVRRTALFNQVPILGR